MAHRVSSHQSLPADASYLALRYQGITSWLYDRRPWASLGFLQWIIICRPSLLFWSTLVIAIDPK